LAEMPKTCGTQDMEKSQDQELTCTVTIQSQVLRRTEKPKKKIMNRLKQIKLLPSRRRENLVV